MSNPARIGVVCLLVAQASFAGDVQMPSLDTPYDQWTWLAAHNSYANPDEGFDPIHSNQPFSTTDQLNYGARLLNPDIWLVRQKQKINPLTGFCQWLYEVYPDDNTTIRDQEFAGRPLEVVLAHGDSRGNLYGGFRQYCTPFRKLRAELDEIGEWLEDHPNELVTVVLETKIHGDYETQLINPAINESKMAKFIFRPNAQNSDVPAPEGRSGGWYVDRYGYPTLRQLVEANKRAVLFPPYPPDSDDGSWKLQVMTVYGRDCLPPSDIGRHWISARDESAALNDFRRPLFWVAHIPNLPEINNYANAGGINDVRVLRKKWLDIEELYNRLPTAIWMDYPDRGYNGAFNPGDPPGPALFLNELNATWTGLPAITGVSQKTPSPSAHGWNNGDVQMVLSGTGDQIQAIISRSWSSPSDTDPVAIKKSNYLVQAEGITTVSFNAIGNLGNRSPTRLVDIRIDKTPPAITGQLSRPADRNGWYASNVTARFTCSDTLSGIAFCPEEIIVTGEGTNQSVTGMAIDRADNRSTATITNINIDKTPPVIRAAASPARLWPPNGKLVPVVISGTITDAASGVDPASFSYSVKDEYQRTQPSGRITLNRSGAFSFTIRLETKRNGSDRDGRHYLVQLNARDRVGHPSQSTLVVTVPHDNRSR